MKILNNIINSLIVTIAHGLSTTFSKKFIVELWSSFENIKIILYNFQY